MLNFMLCVFSHNAKKLKNGSKDILPWGLCCLAVLFGALFPQVSAQLVPLLCSSSLRNCHLLRDAGPPSPKWHPPGTFLSHSLPCHLTHFLNSI